MSRSNPNKKKRRVAKKTILIYGEGQSDEIFLRHLRKLYARNTGVALTIKKGNGGTPKAIVESAIRYSGDFNKKYAVIDCDKSKKEMQAARDLAKYNKIELIENTPCLEALLLSIIHVGRNFRSQKSLWCKNEFEKKYISKKQRTDCHRYEELFTQTLLEAGRKSLSELNQIISIMEGGNS